MMVFAGHCLARGLAAVFPWQSGDKSPHSKKKPHAAMMPACGYGLLEPMARY